MLKIILVALVPFLVLFSEGLNQLFPTQKQNNPAADSGTLEKMIVANGSVSIDLDLNRLNGAPQQSKSTALRFNVGGDSFFTVLAFNNEFRGPQPGSMAIVPLQPANLPTRLNASYQNLVVESNAGAGDFDLTIRDAKTGFLFFNVEGALFEYEPNARLLVLQPGRLQISKEFAAELGRPADAGLVVGNISLTANLRQTEVTKIVNGNIDSTVMPANLETGTVPGPDVVVGNLFSLTQFGSSGTQVGLAVGTDSCNFGTVNLNWFANPTNDHPVIPQNLYRMSGGAANDERFEQIGQSNVKHAFTALTEDICNLGCNNVGGSQLGSGCSDPYSASLNAGPNLGSRAWINPFTGAYPRNDDANPNNRNNNHSGHSHSGVSHRVLSEASDLNTTMNPGASYYAEAQYITPHEYAWCQANPGQCNMYNNVSYRKYNVSGTTSFSFSPAAATERMKAAVNAWPGATFVEVKPDPGNDGVAIVAYKVTNTSPGVWHYEYAVYNQNLDRGIQSFTVPAGAGVTLSNIGFHAPPQHPGWAADGTVGNTGFSSTPWTQNQAGGAIAWNTETFAQNQNANAIRWGTLYNFRFDSNRPPQTANATVGFFKTGSPANVQIQAPTPTASNVTVSGRVTSFGWRGIGYAKVTITDSGGNARSVYTSSFGYFTIPNVATGGTYTISVAKKRYSFTPQQMPINDNLTNVNFVAN